MTRIVFARPPRRIRRKPKTATAAVRPSVVVEHRKQQRETDAEEHRQRGDAADALWRELVRRVSQDR